MTEDAPATPPASDAPQDSGQTIEAPVAAFGSTPPKEGDICQFRVIGLDSNSGVVNLSLVQPETKPDFKGSDSMSEGMDDQPPKKGMM
jgi:hypothetical protein